MPENVFMSVVAPLFGNLLATGLLLSPFPAILAIRRNHALGSINPLILLFTVYNCFGWTVYGLVTVNLWVVPANAVGILGGLFFTMTAYAHAPSKTQDMLTGLILFATVHFICFGLLQVFALSRDAGIQLWGISSLVVLLVYYTSPLSTMLQVLKTRDASSIYLPVSIMAIANGSMWTIYGFALHDFNLWFPNGFGAILGVVQVALRLIFGAQQRPQAAHGSLQDRGGGLGLAQVDSAQLPLTAGLVSSSGSLATERQHSEIQVFHDTGHKLSNGSVFGSAAARQANGTNGSNHLPGGGGAVDGRFTL